MATFLKKPLLYENEAMSDSHSPKIFEKEGDGEWEPPPEAWKKQDKTIKSKVLGAVRGVLVGIVLAPAYSVACAVTALVWTPRMFCRSCKALHTKFCCAPQHREA